MSEEFYTKDANVIRTAIAEGKAASPEVHYDEDLFQWHLRVLVIIDGKKVTFEGKGFRAVDLAAAHRKANAQFDRMITGRNTARPKLPRSYQKARNALKAKLDKVNESLPEHSPRILQFSVDWSNYGIKVRSSTRHTQAEYHELQMAYEPEFSNFQTELKQLLKIAD